MHPSGYPSVHRSRIGAEVAATNPRGRLPDLRIGDGSEGGCGRFPRRAHRRAAGTGLASKAFDPACAWWARERSLQPASEEHKQQRGDENRHQSVHCGLTPEDYRISLRP